MPLLSDDELINLYYQEGSVSEKARRCGMSPRQLSGVWSRLRQKGQLPITYQSAAGNVVREQDRKILDYDGRPSVEMLHKDDLLLQRLRRYHGPSAPDESNGGFG